MYEASEAVRSAVGYGAPGSEGVFCSLVSPSTAAARVAHAMTAPGDYQAGADSIYHAGRGTCACAAGAIASVPTRPGAWRNRDRPVATKHLSSAESKFSKYNVNNKTRASEERVLLQLRFNTRQSYVTASWLQGDAVLLMGRTNLHSPRTAPLPCACPLRCCIRIPIRQERTKSTHIVRRSRVLPTDDR